MAETVLSIQINTGAKLGVPVVCLTLQIALGQHQNVFWYSGTDPMPLFRQSWVKIMPLYLYTGKLSIQGKHQKSISLLNILKLRQHLVNSKWQMFSFVWTWNKGACREFLLNSTRVAL